MKLINILREGDATGASGGNGTAANTPVVPAQTSLATPVVFPKEDWRSTLPTELQGDPSIRDVKTVPDLVKMHINAQKLIGAPKVALPQDGWGDKDWNEFFDKSGRPASEKDYKLPPVFAADQTPTDPKGIKLPAGIKEDPAAKDAFLKAFHDSGLNNRQANTLYQKYWEIQSKHIEGQRAAELEQFNKTTVALQTEWGPQFNERVALAKMAAQHFGGEEMSAWMTKNNLDNDPTFIKMWYKVGAGMSEDQARGKGGGGGMGTSPQSAQSEIKALQLDKEFMKAYTDKRNPGHAAAKTKMDGLFQTAYPGKTDFNK